MIKTTLFEILTCFEALLKDLRKIFQWKVGRFYPKILTPGLFSSPEKIGG